MIVGKKIFTQIVTVPMNPQAQELNEVIISKNPVVFDLLSQKGKNIFFPKKGILGQTAEAKGTRINATIGAAIEDDARQCA